MTARVLAAFFLLCSIAGCSTVPLASIPKLMRIDARTTELPDLRVAVQLPRMLRPREGGVLLDVEVKSGSSSQKTAFPLIEVLDEGEREALPQRRPDTHLFIFRLSPADVVSLETFRAEASKMSAGGKGTELVISVATRHFCINEQPSRDPLLATIYLKTTETRSYVAVIKDLDLLSDEHIARELAKMTPCAKV